MKMRRLVLAIIMTAGLASTALGASYANITSTQAKSLIDKGKIFLLDVRTPDEYRQAHLQGAVLIPVDQVERRLREIPKDKTVLVYCAVGSRSSAVAGFLVQKGYREVYNMTDGIIGWYRNGLPLAR
jgi:rhodanese-related sulfurtransferase